MSENVNIEVVSVGDLERLAQAALFDRECYPVIPISKQRAYAQSRNPIATAQDVGLVVARKAGGACVGYLGLLPQMLRSGTMERKIAAISTLYLDKTLRGTGVAARMLDAAQNVGYDLLSVGNSQAAQAFLRKQGLRPLPAYGMLHLQLGVGYGVSRAAQFAKKVLRAAGLRSWQGAIDEIRDMILALCRPVDLHLGRQRASRLATIAMPQGVRVPVLHSTLATEQRDKPHIHWSNAALNWLLHHPWYLHDPSGIANVQSMYHFGASNRIFLYVAEELYSTQGILQGFAIYLVRWYHHQRSLSIVHYRLDVSDRHRILLARAIDLAAKIGADCLIAGREVLRVARQEELVGAEESFRTSFVSSTGTFEAFEESYADGDMAFY